MRFRYDNKNSYRRLVATIIIARITTIAKTIAITKQTNAQKEKRKKKKILENST